MSLAQSMVYAASSSALLHAQELAQELLSDEELLKLASLRFPHRRGDWLLGRMTAKHIYILSPDWTGPVSDIRKVSVRNETDGAPYFYDERSGRIPGSLSISHRDAQAFCAWTADAEMKIGVDIEKVEPRGDIPLEIYFSENEIARNSALAANLRDAWITLMWSIKEAVLKGCGIGLRVDARLVQIGDVQGQISDTGGGWRPFQVGYKNENWKGFWKRREDILLTIAGKHKLNFEWSLDEIRLDW